uniref:Nodulin-like domain-containing protein n=1 Tax=Ananas comosus var. bracteatus TaxID=296719 RepID=A0A6V7P2M3_ANACO|nr:unnamed protein product [Ananas comosus var. bracteatus]
MAGAVKGGSRPPWVGLGAAVWVQVAAGSAYTFPLYSHALKAVLGLRQQQVAMLGVANDMGENLGLVPGLLCNRLAPGLALAVGAAACFLGFGLLWLAVSRTLLGLPYCLLQSVCMQNKFNLSIQIQLWIALYVGTNSSAWLMTAVLVTNMRNFPVSRGTVAGILKGYAGLSAAVFTPIYSGLLDSSPGNSCSSSHWASCCLPRHDVLHQALHSRLRRRLLSARPFSVHADLQRLSRHLPSHHDGFE